MEQIYITVSTKGQLVIPAAIREELGIEPGTRVAVRREGPEFILKPETLAAKLAMIKKMRGVHLWWTIVRSDDVLRTGGWSASASWQEEGY